MGDKATSSCAEFQHWYNRLVKYLMLSVINCEEKPNLMKVSKTLSHTYTKEMSHATSLVWHSKVGACNPNCRHENCNTPRFRHNALSRNRTSLRLQCRHQLYKPLAILTPASKRPSPLRAFRRSSLLISAPQRKLTIFCDAAIGATNLGSVSSMEQNPDFSFTATGFRIVCLS